MNSTSEEAYSTWPGYYSCNDLVPPLCDDQLQVTTGSVETLPGLSIAYWRYAPKNVSSSDLMPAIIAINGGPGLAHNYLKPLRALACGGHNSTLASREVIFYDQAGTGASRIQPTENEEFPVYPKEIYDIKYYAETELPALINHLKLQKFHLLGSSWGTQISLQYLVSHMESNSQNTRQAPSLQSLILNGPVPDNHLFVQYQWDLKEGVIGKLPLYVQKRLLQNRYHYDSPEYQNIDRNLQTINNARLGTLVDCWMETANAGFFNGQHLERLAGPSDFFDDFQSTLGNWTILPTLTEMVKTDQYKVPPIMLNYGEFDFVHPRLVADAAQALQYHNVECHRIPRAGHSSSLDSPEFIYPRMHDFLTRVEDPKIPFRVDPNGNCPKYDDQNDGGIVTIMDGDYDVIGTKSLESSYCVEHQNGFSRQGLSFSTTHQLLLLVVLVGFAFVAGAWYGEKRARKQHASKGYEFVGESMVEY